MKSHYIDLRPAEPINTERAAECSKAIEIHKTQTLSEYMYIRPTSIILRFGIFFGKIQNSLIIASVA